MHFINEPDLYPIEEQIEHENAKYTSLDALIKSESSYSPKTANEIYSFESNHNLTSESFSLSQFPSVASLSTNSSSSNSSSSSIGGGVCSLNSNNNMSLLSAGSSVSSINPVSPSSSGSSLSFPSDINMSNHFFTVNNIYYDHNQTEWTPHDNCLGSLQTFETIPSSRKHDVSCGTEFSTNENKCLKKDSHWSPSCFKMANRTANNNINKYNPTLSGSQLVGYFPVNVSDSSSVSSINSAPYLTYKQQQQQPSSESFRLVEKILPKKSRTKYSKDQLQILEEAFVRSSYPDVILIESLCKQLDISKEKINIWFQNRRARSKRGSGGSKIKNINSTNSSTAQEGSANRSSPNQINARVITINSSTHHVQQNNFHVASSPTFWSNNNSMGSFVTSGFEA